MHGKCQRIIVSRYSGKNELIRSVEHLVQF